MWCSRYIPLYSMQEHISLVMNAQESVLHKDLGLEMRVSCTRYVA
jgi:hypothetical protein